MRGNSNRSKALPFGHAPWASPLDEWRMLPPARFAPEAPDGTSRAGGYPNLPSIVSKIESLITKTPQRIFSWNDLHPTDSGY
jgi:hypothetical protein